MIPERLQAALESTLDDGRFSRGERRALSELVAELGLSSDKLAESRHLAFDMARARTVDPAALEALAWLEEAVKSLLPAEPLASATAPDEALFSPGDRCPERIAALLRRARKAVDICVFTITDDRISNSILEAHRRGVRVRIVSDNDKALDLGSDIHRLLEGGVPVRVDESPDHMHHKFALFDAQTLATGSYNWTRGAAERNRENLVLLHERHLIAEFSREFGEIWKNSAEPRPG